MTARKPELVEVDTPVDPPPLYGDAPTFSYTPKDGGDPIVFPAHSTIRQREIGGETYFEMLWRFDEDQLSNADQIFAYLRRSGATREMKRRVVRLPEDEIAVFFNEWMRATDEPAAGASLPPES